MTAIPPGVMADADEGWLPPPTGPTTEAGTEEQQVKVSPAEVSALVDKIVEAIGKLEDTAAKVFKEEALGSNPGELYGWSLVIGYFIKKYAMKSDMILVGTGMLMIIGSWAMKLTTIANKRREEGKPLFGAKPRPKTTQQQMEEFVAKQPPEQVGEFTKVHEGTEGTAA
jgi:hypothetical protein